MMYTIARPVKNRPITSQMINRRRQAAIRTNVLKLENAYELQLSVPGFSKNEIEIEVKENQLFISGKPSDVQENTAIRKEFVKGEFQKSFQLPNEVDVENITAECNAGILHINMPLLPENKIRKVNIQ